MKKLHPKSEPAKFREYAGVLTAFIVVIAYISIGFVTGLSQLITGSEITLPEDWRSAMLSLASAALGYLIGKQILDGAPPAPKIESYTKEDVEVAYKAETCACPICGNFTDCSLIEDYKRSTPMASKFEAGAV